MRPWKGYRMGLGRKYLLDIGFLGSKIKLRSKEEEEDLVWIFYQTLTLTYSLSGLG
jgi:hypothetical protein